MADHWKEKERFLTGLITAAAGRRLRRAEDARDCVVIFLEKALEIPEAQEWPYSAEAASKLAAAAERCADAERSRLRRLRRRESLDTDLGGAMRLSAVAGLAPPAFAPERSTILRLTFQLIAIAIGQLPRGYITLFRAVFWENKTAAEFARETGKSRQAVSRSVRRLIAAIRRILAGMGLDDLEIADLLNYLERSR